MGMDGNISSTAPSPLPGQAQPLMLGGHQETKPVTVEEVERLEGPPSESASLTTVTTDPESELISDTWPGDVLITSPNYGNSESTNLLILSSSSPPAATNISAKSTKNT
jgi:hypothetical protein